MLRIAIALVEIGCRGIGKRVLELWIVAHTHIRRHVYRRPKQTPNGKSRQPTTQTSMSWLCNVSTPSSCHTHISTHTHPNMENSANVSLCTLRIEVTFEHWILLWMIWGVFAFDASQTCSFHSSTFQMAYLSVWLLLCVLHYNIDSAVHSVSLMTGTENQCSNVLANVLSLP